MESNLFWVHMNITVNLYSSITSLFWREGKDLYDKKEMHEKNFFSFDHFIRFFSIKYQNNQNSIYYKHCSDSRCQKS